MSCAPTHAEPYCLSRHVHDITANATNNNAMTIAGQEAKVHNNGFLPSEAYYLSPNRPMIRVT